MAVLLAVRQLQAFVDEWLGQGLPAPADAMRRAGFRPDVPWSWCPRCGGARHGAASRSGSRCRAAEAGAGAPGRVVRLGAHDGALRRWVVDVKHAGWEPMAEALGEALGRQLLACGAVARADAGTVLVSVPSPWLRTAARGLDHAAAIARGVSRATGVRVRRPIAQQLGGSQVDATGRESRVARAPRFRARWRGARAVAGRHVVLVDDVRTTGTTLADAARVLRALGAARVTAAVVSVRE